MNDDMLILVHLYSFRRYIIIYFPLVITFIAAVKCPMSPGTGDGENRNAPNKTNFFLETVMETGISLNLCWIIGS